MQKYDGMLIHQERDDEGVIEIIEKQGVRALHFGSSSQQSSMALIQPYRLHARYTRAMMAWLLFKEPTDNVLMVGLGGGILAKFFLYHFPECRIQMIEFRPAMVKIARRFFALPLDARLKIKIGDGAEYIARQSKRAHSQHDLIMIDAFDAEGMAESMRGIKLFSACKDLLMDDGLLVINLWGNQQTKAVFEQIVWEMGNVFNWQVLFLPVRKRGNIIGLAFGENYTPKRMKDIRKKAKQLDAFYDIEFLTFVNDLKRNNHSVLNRVIK